MPGSHTIKPRMVKPSMWAQSPLSRLVATHRRQGPAGHGSHAPRRAPGWRRSCGGEMWHPSDRPKEKRHVGFHQSEFRRDTLVTDCKTSRRRPGAARRLFQCRDRRHRTGRPRRGARRDRPGTPNGARARRARLRHRHLARRPGADQQPRGRRLQADPAARQRRRRQRGACARRRSRHRPGTAARRRRARPALCIARQFEDPAPRPAGGRDRQSARIRIDRHRRRGVGAGPLDPLGLAAAPSRT